MGTLRRKSPIWLHCLVTHVPAPVEAPLPDTGGSERLKRSLQPESRKVLLYLLSTEPKYLATG